MAQRVLVVDDSMRVRQRVTQALSPDFAVIEAVDGLDALERLQDACDIALILCDVAMPRMGGLEFLEAWRRVPERARAPVVMLTTEGQPALVGRAKELGAKAWILKPFQPHLLLAAVRRLTST